MPKYAGLFVFVLLISFIRVGGAWADTDYQCLNRCVASGKGSMACLKACEVSPSLPQKKQPKAKQAHRQFASPEIADDKLIMKPKTISPAQDASPVCMQNCLLPGITYAYCRAQCLSGGNEVK